jgi:hypothetical protein
MNDVPPRPPRAHDATPPKQAAPNTQYYLSVLHKAIDITADLMRMVHSQVQQQFEATQPNETANTPPPPPPCPPITEDPFGTIKELGRGLRLTVALADRLEHPVQPPANPRPAPYRPGLRDMDDLYQLSEAEARAEISKMSDAELNDWREALERERAEHDPPEHDPPEHDLADSGLNRPIPDIIAGICRDLGIAQLHDGHPWKQRFLTELTGLVTYAAVQNTLTPDEPTPRNFTTPPPDS